MSKSRRRILMGAIVAVGAFAVTPAQAQDADAPATTLFTS